MSSESDKGLNTTVDIGEKGDGEKRDRGYGIIG